MTDNELLLAISNMMDFKLKSELQPIKNDLQSVKSDLQNVHNKIQSIELEIQELKAAYLKMDLEIREIKFCLENEILPRLNTIEACYTSTYDRYKRYTDRIESTFEDVDLLKKVVTEHSEKLQKLA